MENLKLVRKVKKMSNRHQMQRERDMGGSVSARMPSYAQTGRDFYDHYLDDNVTNQVQEGGHLIKIKIFKKHFKMLNNIPEYLTFNLGDFNRIKKIFAKLSPD